MIPRAKQKSNYKKLGVKLSSGTFYRTLKVTKGSKQASPRLIETKLTNDFFLSTGPLLSHKLPETEKRTKIPRRKNS